LPQRRGYISKGKKEMNQPTLGIRSLTAAELLAICGGEGETITDEQATELANCIGGITSDAEGANVNTACLNVITSTAPGSTPVDQDPAASAPPPNVMGDPQPGGGASTTTLDYESY
jgi:hypothetical protein